ncbi:hypothetical protein HYT56_03220 [Candidatus Woesearchaeota archaeon]|nr:hypothetical protein [Candidatus Woesearchaeota archaeon]
MVLAFILAFILGASNYLSDRISYHCSKYKAEIISLVSGISVAYIFLSLLPELYESVGLISRSLFIFVLIGFASFHLVEKFIYQHVGKGKISEDLNLSHSLGLFLYDFSVGMVLAGFAGRGFIEAILFFIVILPHTALSNLSITKIHGLHHHKKIIIESKLTRILLAGASVYGVILANFYSVSSKLSHSLTGLVAGILLYVVIRETIPRDKEGNPLFFIIGVLIYSLLIFWIWTIA